MLIFWVGVAPGATVFRDGFESGSLSPAWEISTTGTGRAIVSTNHGPAAGQSHLVLDDSVNDAIYSAVEATLQVDLSNKKNVVLSFKAKSLGNEPDYPQYGFPGFLENFDGVSISNDRGATWRVLESLAEVAADWETFLIPLDDSIAWNARFGPEFLIRFSEYDNAAAPLDGIAIDEILITAEDDQRAVLELPTTLLEGTGPHTGYVLLTFAPANAITLNLLAAPGGQLLLPATVQVPAGQTFASFNFSVADDGLVNLARSVFVSADAPGVTAMQGAVTILDDETPVATVMLPPELAEGEFPNNNASVSLDRAPDVPMTLRLSTSPWGELEVPYEITVPVGETNVVFAVRAVDDSRIDGTVAVVVTVTSPGMAPAVAQTATLDNETHTLSLNLPATVLEGRTANGTVELAGTLSTNFQVHLVSANAGELSVPVAVTIPAGWVQAEFAITANDNLIRDGSRPVGVTASASAFPDAEATITIRDNEVAAYLFRGLTDIVDVGRPIALTVSAADVEGNAINGFNGGVNLSLVLNDGSIQALPPLSVNLTGTNGWTGNVTLPPINASPLRLRALDASGNVGDSIPFDTMHVLALPAADLVWDPVRARLYASVPADADSTNANQVVAIDPATSAVVGGILAGQDPGRIALTSGGEKLYVALNDNGTVVRINLATWSSDLTFPVGTDPSFGTLYAADMCTVAGQPDLLVISRSRSSSYGHHSVAAFDHGVARLTNTSYFNGSSSAIEPSADPSIFFGYNTESTEGGFRRLRLDASGITQIEVNTTLVPYFTDIRSDGNTVFSSSGVVFDGSQMRRLGTFPVHGPVCPELAANRVYFIEPENPEYSWPPEFDKIGAYDPITFSNIRRLTLPVDVISPKSFIRWGTNGLAFVTETNVVLINSSRLVPSDTPANLVVTVDAAPNPATVSAPLVYTVSVSNQGPNIAASTFLTIALSDGQAVHGVQASIGAPQVSSNAVTLDVGELAVGAGATMSVTTLPDSAGRLTGTAGAASAAIDPDFTDNVAVKEVNAGFQSVVNVVNRLRLAANNLIYDSTRNLLWASLPDTAEPPLGKTVVSIDPSSGLVSVPIPIKGNPVAQCMAISGNGRYLYVGLSNTNQVHRIDLNSPSISLRIPLGLSQWGGENYAQDIEPLDGDGTSFLMTGSSDQAAAVYDGVFRRSNRTAAYSVDLIERTGTPGVFMGYSSGSQISSLAVTPTGVAITRQVGNIITGYGVAIRSAGNLVLSSTGLLVDGTNLSLKASFGFSGRPCLDKANHRAHLVQGNTLRSFDTETFLPAGVFGLPFAAAEDWNGGRTETCLRWGLDGFAFLGNSGNVYIWRWSSAIPASADANADGISDAWEARYFGTLNVDPAGDNDGDGIGNFLEYLFVTSPVQASANPVRVSTATIANQPAIRLVFPRRAGLAWNCEYLVSSDLSQWIKALNVSESVLATQDVDGVRVDTVEALIPASNAVCEFVRFRWSR